jgi:hypothetical protein
MNWTNNILNKTLFMVDLVNGKATKIRIIDNYSNYNIEFLDWVESVTPREREEIGIYTAKDLGINYESIMDYDRYSSFVMDSDDFIKEEYILSEIEHYWYECACKHFQPMTRRLLAILAWEKENDIVLPRYISSEAW